MVARAICVLARATCYLVRAMTTIARAMMFSSAGTLEIAIYNRKYRAMTTHLKRLECIDWNLESIDLFLFVRLFWCFRFFCYCIFLFVLLLEQGYFNVTLLPMHPAGWGYPPPAAPPTTAAGAAGAGATPQPPPHAAVQPGLQQPSTTPWSMQPQVLAVRTTVSVARTTVSVARATLLLCVLAVSLCALRTSWLRVLCPVFRRRCPSS